MATSYALVVPLGEAEDARQIVASRGKGRADLKVGRREGFLVIPIADPMEPPTPNARVEVAEFEEARPPGSYKERARVPDALRSALPSSFDIVGDLVVLKVPSSLREHEREIARAILEAHPALRGVFADDGVEGPHRVRRLRPLAGVGRTRAVHVEYGARFHVDLATAFFSPRLANEHKRIADAVLPGETFVDATAGVGPFSILAARRRVDARIVAIDVNPAAVALLRENVAANRVDDRVRTVEGEAERVLPDVVPFHRAVVNLPHSGEAILAKAWAHVSSPGTLHYLVVWPQAQAEHRAAQLVERLARLTGRPGALASKKIVHAYSPRERVFSVDLTVR